MFNPAKLLSPLWSQGSGQEEPVYDPYVEKSHLSVSKSESSSDLKAALLLHNFTSIVCLQDYCEDRPNGETTAAAEDGEEIETTIYILAKKQSN